MSIASENEKVLTYSSGDIVGQSDGKVSDDDLVSLCESLSIFQCDHTLVAWP